MNSFLRIILLLILFLISLTGCGNVFYLAQLGWHQSAISFHSEPIREVLESGQSDSKTKEKIRFIQDVKEYGEERFGLRKTKNYSTYYPIKGPVLFIVTGSDKDRLELHTWTFPITGKVTYKGFFTKEAALKEETSLREKGLDTFVQQAGAYSTLGWLRDPIFSSMLQWDEAILANVILHEMAHSTVYFKGNTDLNEQMATFIGNQGAVEFLAEKYGKGSKEEMEALRFQEDDLLFSKWIDQVYQRLSAFYAQRISRDEKIREREGVFRSVGKDFEKMKIFFKTEYYKNFDKNEMNNAVLLAFRRYSHRLETFEAVYQYLDNDLGRMVRFFKKIQASGKEPSSFLERWLKEKGFNAPASPQ